MSRFRVYVDKQLVTDPVVKWTNVYTVEAADYVAALNSGEIAMAAEANIHYASTHFYRIRAHVQGRSPLGASRSVDALGEVAVPATPNTMLPLWNVARVTFPLAIGKPEQKYLRLPLYEDSVDGNFLTAAVVANIQTNYADVMAAYTWYVSPTGLVHTSGTVQEAVQMRQTSWHRRTRAGFKRGWVAR